MKNLTYSRENLDPFGLSHNLTENQMKTLKVITLIVAFIVIGVARAKIEQRWWWALPVLVVAYVICTRPSE